MANIPLKSIKFPGLSDTYTVPQIDDTLAVAGKAADAKKTGDELSDLKSAINGKVNKPTGSGLAGEYLKNNGDGTTSWDDPLDGDVSQAVSDWLDNHPEATTTVDFSIVRKVFDTVAAMQTDLTLEAGDNVATRGYYASGDNGAANYIVGSTHSGVFYIELNNGLYANRLSENGWLTADSIGIKRTATEPSDDVMTANTTLFQAAVTNNIYILFGVGHYWFNDVIHLVPINSYIIKGIDKYKTTLHFPESKGFAFDRTQYYNYWWFKDIGIISYEACIYVAENACTVLDSHFENLYLYSETSDCFLGPTYNVAKYTSQGGQTIYDTCVQNAVFDVINGEAPTSAVFANILGLGNQYKHLNIIGQTKYAFRNCDGRIEHLNTLGVGLDYFIEYDHVYDHAMKLLMIEVNAEGLRKGFIHTEPEVQIAPGEDSHKPTNANIMTLSSLILINSGWSLHPDITACEDFPVLVHNIRSIFQIGTRSLVPSAYPSKYTSAITAPIRETRDLGLRNVFGLKNLNDKAYPAGYLYTLTGMGAGTTVLLASEWHALAGTDVVASNSKFHSYQLYGGKATQVWNTTLTGGGTTWLQNNKDYKYCDVVDATVTGGDKKVSLIFNQSDQRPGRMLTIVNDASSANNLQLLGTDEAGYSNFVYASATNLTLAPKESVTLSLQYWVAGNGETYLAWKKLI